MVACDGREEADVSLPIWEASRMPLKRYVDHARGEVLGDSAGERDGGRAADDFHEVDLTIVWDVNIRIVRPLATPITGRELSYTADQGECKATHGAQNSSEDHCEFAAD